MGFRTGWGNSCALAARRPSARASHILLCGVIGKADAQSPVQIALGQLEGSVHMAGLPCGRLEPEERQIPRSLRKRTITSLL